MDDLRLSLHLLAATVWVGGQLVLGALAPTLRAAGHSVKILGVQDELKPIRDEIESWKPDIVFNLLEEFHGVATYDQNVASYLELQRIPYTGCNPRGLMLARGVPDSDRVGVVRIVGLGDELEPGARLK